jgi:hypothetical protein
MSKVNKKDTKKRANKVLSQQCCGFSLAGDEDVDWDEVDRVDRLLKYQQNGTKKTTTK